MVDCGGYRKVVLDHVYTPSDPRSYFRALSELDYCIPDSAAPHFRRLFQRYRVATGESRPTILDLGCSYGINAAILRCGLTMPDLYTRYCGEAAASLDRDSLVKEDRRLTRSAARDLRVIGLDVAKSATQYGVSAGYLDGAVCADLESADPTDEQSHLLQADIVISTGCLGYVTHRTIARLVDATKGQRPWMAHFAVRTFSFQDIERVLADRGYRTCQIGGPFRQRRFASIEEQSWALDVLRTSGADPSGCESDGWLSANFYVSLPEGCEQSSAASRGN